MQGIAFFTATLAFLAAADLRADVAAPQDSRWKGTQIKKRLDSENSSTTPTVSPSVSISSPPSDAEITTLSIDVGSYMATSSPTAASTSNAASASSTTASSTGGLSTNNRNLIIILCTVLGSLGLITAALVACCLLRHRRRYRAERSVTPIDDDEIASWRRGCSGACEKPEGPELDESPQLPDNIKTPSSGWTWTASPTVSVRPKYPSGLSITDSPVVVLAPNARLGLTDETVPGDVPFIRRPSSRLSKAPPGRRHHRNKSSSGNKSRRSSISVSISTRSFWSAQSGHAELRLNDRVATWYDPDSNFEVGHDLGNASTPSLALALPTPTPTVTPAGGLSPRPKSQLRTWEYPHMPDEDEIGVAIS